MLLAVSKMRIVVSVILLCLCVVQTGAQIIKKASAPDELSSKVLYAKIKPDIFADQLWLEPEFRVKKIEFADDYYYFIFNNSSCLLQKIDSNAIQFQGYGNSFLINKEKSHQNIYYDKTALKRKSSEANRWNVRIHSEEPRTFKTEWKWETVSDSVLDIPEYDYYAFVLDENKILYLFEIPNPSGKPEYYLVNASYLFATDANNLNYILADADCNGVYTDADDKIIFLSWNPYAQDSKYKKLKGIRENCWYDISFLKRQYFLNFVYDKGKLYISNRNDEFKERVKTGLVTFTKIPKDAAMTVNGMRYPLKKGKNGFEIDFGYHRVEITKNGFADFDTILYINGNNLNIRYIKPQAAASLTIKNVFAEDYFVTIKDKNNTETCYKREQFNLAPGNYEIEIYAEGFSIRKQIEIRINSPVEIDFESEVKKQTF